MWFFFKIHAASAPQNVLCPRYKAFPRQRDRSRWRNHVFSLVWIEQLFTIFRNCRIVCNVGCVHINVLKWYWFEVSLFLKTICLQNLWYCFYSSRQAIKDFCWLDLWVAFLTVFNNYRFLALFGCILVRWRSVCALFILHILVESCHLNELYFSHNIYTMSLNVCSTMCSDKEIV